MFIPVSVAFSFRKFLTDAINGRLYGAISTVRKILLNKLLKQRSVLMRLMDVKKDDLFVHKDVKQLRQLIFTQAGCAAYWQKEFWPTAGKAHFNSLDFFTKPHYCLLQFFIGHGFHIQKI